MSSCTSRRANVPSVRLFVLEDGPFLWRMFWAYSKCLLSLTPPETWGGCLCSTSTLIGCKILVFWHSDSQIVRATFVVTNGWWEGRMASIWVNTWAGLDVQCNKQANNQPYKVHQYRQIHLGCEKIDSLKKKLLPKCNIRSNILKKFASSYIYKLSCM